MSAERIRLKELAKYYNVANIRARYLRHAPSAHNKYQQDILDVDELRELKRDPAEDRQLTALGQLAARKLDYERCFISITDDRCQHFIAEATQSTSLGSDGFNSQQELLVGVQSVLLEQRWLPTTFTVQKKYFRLDPVEGHDIIEEAGMIIHDLASHKASKKSNLLQAFPRAFRAYMEVPLRTSSGHVFGSICLINSIIRNSRRTDLHQLQEIADLIVDHLDTLRLKADYSRAQRLLQGLAHFIEGKQSLSDWSSTTTGQDFIPAVDAGDQNLSAMTPPFIRTVPKRTGSASSMSIDLEQDVSVPDGLQYVTPTTSEATDPPNVVDSQIEASQREMADPGLLRNAVNDGSRQLGSTTTSVVAEAFSRASNLIRESMGLEATCFLEVPHNERAQLGNRRGRSDARRVHVGSTTDTDSASEAAPPPDNASRSKQEAIMCHRLAFSTKGRSSVARSYATAKYLTIPAGTLKALASKFPGGRIFHFYGGDGTSSSDENAEEIGARPTALDGAAPQDKKRKISHQLSELFPDARSLVFVPLFDSDRQHIFAGFLGWTADATRSLQEHEVTFIKGFVDSVMCEVQRLEALSTDKAKSDFIASISHELRTPLHGILASAQLLSNGEKFDQQSEFIDMISTCGNTLLDVMDHLFDYAKINNFTQRGRKASLQEKSGGNVKKTFSLVSDVNLANIVEETAASVAASSNQLLRQRRNSFSNSIQIEPTAIEKPTVPIILSINKAENWTFRTESGSWRRIIMNLVGNSLKYTAQGHILVKLSTAQDTTPAASLDNFLVKLRINDTGQGISEEYLKHRLFTAFAQEDNLSVGTGLGLSLVNHIVTTLDGRIEVQSEIGQGTEICIKIPVLAATDTPADAHASDIQSVSALVGMKVAISGFAEAPLSPTGVPVPHQTALLALKQSLTDIVIDWFKMTVVSTDAEIHIVEQSYLESHSEEYDRPEQNILVVGIERVRFSMVRARHLYLAAPIGPMRLAKAMRSLLAMKDANMRFQESQRSVKEVRDEVHNLQGLPISHSTRPKSSQRTEKTDEPEKSEKDTSSTETPRPPQRRTSSNRTIIAMPPNPAEPRPTVLLVDDNDINLRVLVSFVQRLRTHEILTASNGKEALDIFTSSSDKGKAIPLILMDITMPIMDGFEATKRIRSYESSNARTGVQPTKIIALTGLGSEEAQRQIESCGFDEYVRKPVSLKQLREILYTQVSIA